MYDVYQGKTDPRERVAVRLGADLPQHLLPADWVLMPPGSSQLHDDVDEDVEARGFSFFKLL